jgi:hypothetical protein
MKIQIFSKQYIIDVTFQQTLHETSFWKFQPTFERF